MNLWSPDLGVGKNYSCSENPESCQEAPPEAQSQAAESCSHSHPSSLEGAYSTEQVKA